jgi:membrane protein implicated in regulation of membrane protease activity
VGGVAEHGVEGGVVGGAAGEPGGGPDGDPAGGDVVHDCRGYDAVLRASAPPAVGGTAGRPDRARLQNVAAWLLWLIAGGLFAAGEIASLDLVLLMFAGGALGGMTVALLGLGVPFQLLAFLAVSAALLLVVRPVAKHHLVDRTPEQIDGVAVFVGRTGVVSQRVGNDAGRIRLGHDEWTARTQLDGEVYEVGDEVRIVQIEGPIAYVSHC